MNAALWRFFDRFESSQQQTGPKRLDWMVVVLLTIGLGLELRFGDLRFPVSEAAVGLAVFALVPFRRLLPLLSLLVGLTITLGNVLLTWWVVESPPALTLDNSSSDIVALAIVVLAFSVFRWRPAREAALAFGVLVATGVLTDLALGTEGTLQAIISSLVNWGLVVAVAAALRYRATLNQGRLDQARLQERQDLARELHDVVAHHVSAIAIQAQAAQAVADVNPEAVLTSLASIEETASHTLNEMRRMVGILRGTDDNAPMVGSLTLADLANAPGTPPAHLRGASELDAHLPIAVNAALIRIVQESITNGRRHGSARDPIDVLVSQDNKQIELRITNTITSSSQRSHGGFGLIGMQERATSLGGALTAQRLAGDRWQVHATIPFRSSNKVENP